MTGKVILSTVEISRPTIIASTPSPMPLVYPDSTPEKTDNAPKAEAKAQFMSDQSSTIAPLIPGGVFHAQCE